jgi:hypothetical protein
MSLSRNWDSPMHATPLPQASGLPPLSSAAVGMGESQFRRLEKKLSTLPILWATVMIAELISERLFFVVLPMYTMTTFPNLPCTTTTTGTPFTRGTCYSPDDCLRTGGRTGGSCAQGKMTVHRLTEVSESSCDSVQ